MKIPRILFISHTRRIKQPYLDPSVRYRCYNFGEYIRSQGGITDVISLHEFRNELIDYYDYFIFHRPSQRVTNLAIILKKMREKNKYYHADYDDLIFSVGYAQDSSIYLNKLHKEKEVIQMFQDNYDSLNLFDYFTVSTEALFEEIYKVKPDAKVKVIPNGLSYCLLQSLGLIKDKQNLRSKVTSNKMISYFSGTSSHDQDFNYIKDVLIKFLERKRYFYLLVAGPLNFNINEFPYGSVSRQKYLPYRSFFETLGDAHINIAPLLPDNRFNECKSSLKFFESGIWGVPTIASPTEDYNRFLDSKGLMLPRSIEQWEEYLETITNPEHYKCSADGLNRYCLEKCLCSNQAEKLISFVNHRCIDTV